MSIVKRRLRAVYEKAQVIPFNASSKFIIMSDCHRGQGTTNDNFLPNQTLFFGALEHYYENGFTYIELGDGDELWENRKAQPVVEVHSDAFWMMSRFYKKDRFYMLFGNHDAAKRKKAYMERFFSSFYCDSYASCIPLFPGIQALEGLILENADLDGRIFLVHGHQGSLLNDLLWPLARFLVRYVWGPLELVGFIAPTGAGRSHKQREKIEKKIASFAAEKQQLVIAGHTHRPVFPSPGESLYFNDGSCVHPRCITGIEIENNAICLIKWAVHVKKDGSLFVGREILEGPVLLSDFYDLRKSGKKPK